MLITICTSRDEALVTQLARSIRDARTLAQGQWIHKLVDQSVQSHNRYLRNLLVEMYGKCHDLELAVAIFETMPERNTVSWNAMLHGYAKNAHAVETLDLYKRMACEGVEPDTTTLIATLIACNHIGLLALAIHHFSSMSFDHSIAETIDHYCCMIDILGRAGKIPEAQELLHTMPFQANHVAYTALLNSSRNAPLASSVRSFPVDTMYVLLSNLAAQNATFHN
ncbi:hypothetical protein SELMODRAFT_133872 [Selaginella moellendorffii]|uniref:Pentacotripeptide-repeat region of PRORP domain-containing protein n=1 Tax=Selaginella moellendorffii TaxID=88036 RepID=D8T7M2_SELML|nr:hypothetical protein SELMODRAFT_133872 [Selaginella moellendorffii]